MTANITGKITGIKYVPLLGDALSECDFAHFDINTAPSACVVHDGQYTFALSQWLSPKRSRSYPFGRVYNTLNHSKKITVIPVMKDEGQAGDCDYIQWDTVSLMSLLDVFVIFAYYESAEKGTREKKGKTVQKTINQQFDSLSVNAKIKEIEQYHSSALHWNLNELKTNFHIVLNQAEQAYQKIEKQTGVILHNHRGLERIKKKIGKSVSEFMEFSRQKSEQAQNREVVTIQPKESLQSLTKAKISIFNYLGGAYFLTVDEVKMVGKKVVLIESKHSDDAQLPSINDIKDGLWKMALFSNLTDVIVDSVIKESIAMLVLTSPCIQGLITSRDSSRKLNEFFVMNETLMSKRKLIDTLFKEANTNNFIVEIRNSK